jgi:AcrR family transcriptional regulator
MVMQPIPDDSRERLIESALELLREHGVESLSLRRVADVAGGSTMNIYSRFGNRMGLLEAVYARGFEMLRDRLVAARDAAASSEDPLEPVLLAYRDFALDHPVLYGVMFERPLPDFDPSIEARGRALDLTFRILRELVAGRMGLSDDDAMKPSYIIWTALHGAVSIELNHVVRSPLPGWFIDTREAGEEVLLESLRALMKGLGSTGR